MPELNPRPWEHPQSTLEVVPQREQPASAERHLAEAVPAQPAVPVKLAPSNPPSPAPSTLPQLTKQVEHVLEEELGELYSELTVQQQAEFKRRGEATANQIAVLLRAVKVKVQQVLKLIRDWLMTIPGVNRYFVEQAAKLKADKLLKLR